jgi:hypothetical protein
MAFGRLGAADLAAVTYTTVYTVPGSGITKATVNINVCNRGTGTAAVRIAVGGTADTPVAADFIEYDLVLNPAGIAGSVVERTGIPLTTGQKVIVYSSVVNVTAQAYGMES